MSFISRALRRFKLVADPLNTRRLVGEDLEGNLYYEVFAQGAGPNARAKRVVEPLKSVDHSDYEDTLPVQWRAWLTRRRPDPPTKEELLAEVRRRHILEARVKALEEKYAEERVRRLEAEKREMESPQLAAATVAPPTAKSPATPAPASGLDPFPSGGSEAFRPGEWTPGGPARGS
ncbi:hypothetical protein M427DRAFT_53944, partial [Gonapodya prolifera JEL478]